MKAIVIHRAGQPVSPNVSCVQDWADDGGMQGPGEGEVSVRVLASALNHLDLWVGIGIPGLQLTYPRVSGSDACGVIERVGAGVHASWIGKRVIVNAAQPTPGHRLPADPSDASRAPDYTMLGEHTHGTHRESFLIPLANVAPIADDGDPVEAAAFGLTFLTAYSMMVGKAALRPGQRVLVTGIGGGVAIAALAIARWMECPVAVTSRHQWKLDRARELGADLLVLDQGQDWSREVRAWAGKGRGGVEVAVDSSGKATHLTCIKSMARGGAYVTPGCTSGPDAVTDLSRIFWNQLRILGSTMGTCDEFAEVVALYRGGALKPVVDRVFRADEGTEAYARLESAEQFGKVVVDWR